MKGEASSRSSQGILADFFGLSQNPKGMRHDFRLLIAAENCPSTVWGLTAMLKDHVPSNPKVGFEWDGLKEVGCGKGRKPELLTVEAATDSTKDVFVVKIQEGLMSA